MVLELFFLEKVGLVHMTLASPVFGGTLRRWYIGEECVKRIVTMLWHNLHVLILLLQKV